MMAGAYTTDNEFHNTFEQKITDIANAADDAYGGMSPGDPDVIIEPYDGYRRFAAGSADAADRVRSAIEEKVLPELVSVAANERGTPVERIRLDYLDDWEGPAADKFGDYLDGLEDALQHLHDSFIAMRGLMACKRSLLLAKREQVLSICGQAEAAIREEETTLKEAVEKILAGALDTAFAGMTGLVSGGPVAGATGAASTFGMHLTQVTLDFANNDAGLVAAVTAAAFDGLQTSMEAEQKELNNGMHSLKNRLREDPESFRPPETEPLQ